MNKFLDRHPKADDVWCYLTSKWRLPILVTLIIWVPVFAVAIPAGFFS